jgi:hypothetical protein
MPATKYTYSIATDTINSAVNLVTLEVEINEASLGQELSHTSTSSDVLDIWFLDALSGADETTLDGVVAAHTAVSQPADILKVVPTVSTVNTSLRIEGAHVSLAANEATKTIWIELVENKRIRGATFCFTGSKYGDYINAKVTDKDLVFKNILYPDPLPVPGVGDVAVNSTNFPEGVDIVEYIPQYFIFPDQRDEVLDPDSSDSIPAGLYLKITYFNEGASVIDGAINFWTYIDV